MKDLLYLAHRIPYPPDKGDKIRSFNLLRRLAERWNVHLGTFVDDENDWRHVDTLSRVCKSVHAVGLNTSMAKLRALRGLLNHRSLTMPYYEDRAMMAWIEHIVRDAEIGCVVAYSACMAQYAIPLQKNGIRAVVDFCDMDSDKWRQYSERQKGLRRWVYRREAEKLLAEEAEIAERCDAAIFVSDQEATIFCRRTGVPARKVHTVGNGVDLHYFDPDIELPNPFQHGFRPVVFTGAMDYWPNVDAVSWFARDIFPAVRAQNPDAVFWIVGSNPSREVRELDALPGVTVTGRVEDVRPYVMFASCVVAPLRLARGVQNKVLEAMAMARPVVATPAAIEGISCGAKSGVTVCGDAAEWVAQVTRVLSDGETSTHSEARRHVSTHHSWDASAIALANLVTDT